MADAVERFRTAMELRGERFEITTMDHSTHTAAEAAAAVGCKVGAIVKSLVFLADGEPILVLVSGPNRVDTDSVGRQLGVEITKADASRVKAATGYSIGGVPPFGHPTPVRTIVDADLLGLSELWAAAGSAVAVFPVAPNRLVELSGGEVLRVS